jgi:hypothetical protein
VLDRARRNLTEVEIRTKVLSAFGLSLAGHAPGRGDLGQSQTEAEPAKAARESFGPLTIVVPSADHRGALREWPVGLKSTRHTCTSCTEMVGAGGVLAQVGWAAAMTMPRRDGRALRYRREQRDSVTGVTGRKRRFGASSAGRAEQTSVGCDDKLGREGEEVAK